ncbi:MAG: hypothetical protein ACLR8Y_07635 [Alistipes indistinctus]
MITDRNGSAGDATPGLEGYIHQIGLAQHAEPETGRLENITYRKASIALWRARGPTKPRKRRRSLDQSAEGGRETSRRASDIALVALNRSDKVGEPRSEGRICLRVDFESWWATNPRSRANANRYSARIIGPDGYVLANRSNAAFNYEGDMITYSATRQVDLPERRDLSVSLFYEWYGASRAASTR